MKRVAIFDAYGTLFDVRAAARHLAGEPGGEEFAAIWEQVARDWRLKQLHYSWLRAICGAHTDFWSVTQDSLDWALDAAGWVAPARALGRPQGAGGARGARQGAGASSKGR